MAFLLFIIFVFSSTMAFAGDVDNTTTAPASTSSYKLDDIWNRFNSGADGSSGTFSEPFTIPSTGTGKTIVDIMSIAPTSDNTNGAAPADVISGSKFWSLKESAWGLQTGTLIPAPVPETGQINCWDAAGTLLMSCTGTGHDGDLRKGVAWPNPRFTDNGNGTITDNLTGLIWLKNANCFGSRNWPTALDDCNTLSSGSCGLSDGSIAGDWRLPNVEELQSLAHYQFYNPAVPDTAGTGQWTAGKPFNNVQSSYYWSSTSYADINSYAWYLYMHYGVVSQDLKNNGHYFWPVRGGQ